MGHQSGVYAAGQIPVPNLCTTILRELHGYGLSLAPGTITGGLYKIAALFEPLKQTWYEHQMSESQFHNDESRWEVFAAVDGKVGHRWYLWV